MHPPTSGTRRVISLLVWFSCGSPASAESDSKILRVSLFCVRTTQLRDRDGRTSRQVLPEVALDAPQSSRLSLRRLADAAFRAHGPRSDWHRLESDRQRSS